MGSISFDIVHAEHGGPAAARNLGLAKVAAPIVAFTDADCVPEPDWVASVVHHFEVTPTTDAITGPLVDLTKPKRLNVLHRFFHKGSILDHAPQRFSYGGVDMLGMIGANMATRTDALRRLGGFDTAYPHPGGEDYDVALRLQLSRATVDFVPGAIVGHDYPTSLPRLLRRWYAYGFGKEVFRDRHGLDVEDLNLGSSIVESVTNLPTLARGHFGLVGRLPAAPLLAESCFQAGAASARRRLRANP